MQHVPHDLLRAPSARVTGRRQKRRLGFWGWVMWLWGEIADWISGERLLNHRPNGGGVISARALWIALLVWTTAVTFVWLGGNENLGVVVRDRVSWLGATFAAAYAALYARFASQWAYLAGVYNQIKAAESRDKPSDVRKLAQWKAGFIEDAEYLHLASKPSVAAIARAWLREPQVRAEFERNTPGGKRRLEVLRQIVRRSVARSVLKYRQ